MLSYFQFSEADDDARNVLFFDILSLNVVIKKVVTQPRACILIYREKRRSQSSTFLHIREKQGFHFLMRKLRISTKRLHSRLKLIVQVNLKILFYLAPSRMLYDKYFLRYDSVKLRIDFFFDFL